MNECRNDIVDVTVLRIPPNPRVDGSGPPLFGGVPTDLVQFDFPAWCWCGIGRYVSCRA